MTQLSTILLPALKDNYIHLVYSPKSGQAIVIDPTEASVVLAALESYQLTLSYILNTHHHHDHVGGNKELKEKTKAKVIGYIHDAARIPMLDLPVEEGQVIQCLGQPVRIIALPGHTLGHIAYFFEQEHWLFCGDVLFGMGCGRLFEGTPEQMFTSLAKIKALPKNTAIYCGHEYTQANGNFALTLDPKNEILQQRMEQVKKLRQQGIPTVPTSLEKELATNPFLQVSSWEDFARLRKLKDWA
jgi:hydroxyacylglutathione hydrolase